MCVMCWHMNCEEGRRLIPVKRRSQAWRWTQHGSLPVPCDTFGDSCNSRPLCQCQHSGGNYYLHDSVITKTEGRPGSCCTLPDRCHKNPIPYPTPSQSNVQTVTGYSDCFNEGQQQHGHAQQCLGALPPQHSMHTFTQRLSWFSRTSTTVFWALLGTYSGEADKGHFTIESRSERNFYNQNSLWCNTKMLLVLPTPAPNSRNMYNPVTSASPKSCFPHAGTLCQGKFSTRSACGPPDHSMDGHLRRLTDQRYEARSKPAPNVHSQCMSTCHLLMFQAHFSCSLANCAQYTPITTRLPINSLIRMKFLLLLRLPHLPDCHRNVGRIHCTA
ncbi:hypothetical protein BaRGS_00036047 [Batillaria attramentaria]|uniref:Uncharacterized protein n=1 Tax=Batillaria attramentaria TaxID=370345 RepID=A0ABD0JD12_9CAEN